MAKQFGSFKLEGAAEVERMLRQLPEAHAKRVIYSALKAGARVIRKEAKANLQASPSVETKRLINGLTIYKKRGDPRGSAVVTMRASGKLTMEVRKGRKKPMRVRPSKYAHLVEYGTETMPAEPFMRPAVATKAQEAVGKIMEFSARALVREATKLGANAKLK